MQRLSTLTAALLKSLPKATTEREAVALSKFSITLQCPPAFLKVSHRGCMYTVGNWDGWDGEYWVVEDTTGIIYRASSLSDLKEWIALCSAVANGE